ncbi:hypothetical protein L7F22_059794 [Adiantum nelumboides]|nr:hypothetical protein [Adiantum nelumboides]
MESAGYANFQELRSGAGPSIDYMCAQQKPEVDGGLVAFALGQETSRLQDPTSRGGVCEKHSLGLEAKKLAESASPPALIGVDNHVWTFGRQPASDQPVFSFLLFYVFGEHAFLGSKAMATTEAALESVVDPGAWQRLIRILRRRQAKGDWVKGGHVQRDRSRFEERVRGRVGKRERRPSSIAIEGFVLVQISDLGFLVLFCNWSETTVLFCSADLVLVFESGLVFVTSSGLISVTGHWSGLIQISVTDHWFGSAVQVAGLVSGLHRHSPTLLGSWGHMHLRSGHVLKHEHIESASIYTGTYYPSTLGSGPSVGTQGSATQDPHVAASDSSSDFDVMEGYPMQQHPESSSQDMHALGQQPSVSMFSHLKETLSRATRSEHATNEINEGGGEVDSPFTSQIDPVLSESVHVSTPATTPIGLSKLTPSETLRVCHLHWTRYLKVENPNVLDKRGLDINTTIPIMTTKEGPSTLEFEGYE